MSTPQEYLNMSYEAACALLRSDPNKLDEFINQEQFSHEQKQQLCLTAVQISWSTIYKVPDELLNDDIIIACLDKSFDYILEVSPEKISPKIMLVVQDKVDELAYIPRYLRTPEVCLSAVKKSWENIGMVPNDPSYKAVFLEGIQVNWRTFFYLSEAQQQDEEILAALKNKWFALGLKSFPKQFDIQELWRLGIGLDESLFMKLPMEKCTPQICLAAVKKKPSLIRQVPNQLFLEVCIEWVRNDSMALAYVPDTLKEKVIEAVTPEKILSADFRSVALFPEKNSYQNIIDKILDECEHVVVTKPDAFETDGEIRDSYLVYANTDKRLNKTIHVDSNSIRSCLDRMKKNPTINLVLLAHDPYFDGERKIGGLYQREIFELLKSYPNINRITLLTCNSAKSLVLEDEKLINQKLVDRTSKASLPSCGLVLMSSMPDDGKCKSVLEEMNCDHAFIWVKKGDEHSLIYLKKETGITNRFQLKLSDDQVSKLHKTLYPNGKKIPFPNPKENTSDRYLRRDGKGAKLMDKNEFGAFQKIFFASQKYSKKNPEYKTNKQIYSFFNNIKIDESEYPKLKDSLLKSIIDMVKAAKLDRSVFVKGYNYVLHVDTIERRFIAGIKVSAYASEYKNKNVPLFFDNSKSSIDNDEMEKEIEKIVSRVIEQTEEKENPEKEELSQVKSITYEVKPG
ncbi:hypothetical protein DGG96_11130 [Legionella qingyii]|uniref:Uncharacterized protein n=1 Tax=Legionella qingyii TaxID=2184757 RepID=A0A317U2S9_9GAMM|nr:hypothetical protein [Legionella qingyii]PWY55649.1 hypothetical protein DGG96_11130 [Legionella qingyii]RUR21757.1 hypothetical protein ELY20_11040 [Legionella qingyii]